MSRVEVDVTHPDRVLFPGRSSQQRISKRDLVDYYYEVADTMLPHLKGRPLTVQRFPLDVARNAYAQTAVAPYSVRARPGASVATPLEWDELDSSDLRADRFTTREIPKRLAGQRDPWADMSRHARSLSGPLQRLAKLRA